MIIRTCKQCLKVVPAKNLYVATDDKKVEKCCKEHGIQTIMTSKKCLTGTDRVAEVAKKIKSETYINVQGDEPIFNPIDLKKIINRSKKNKKNILLGYTEIKNKSEYKNRNIPKVVFDKNQNLLYASRAPIASSKKGNFVKSWRQVLVYSFPRDKLLKFAKRNKKTLFEALEDIEILRFIELGHVVKLIKMSSLSHPVDTVRDLKIVKNIIKK